MRADASFDPDQIFGPGGLLAQCLPNFDFRPSQLEMAAMVRDALHAGECAVIEAGTGIGKTLAYLWPVIASGRKAVISTATKNLQEQICLKDLPLIETLLARPVPALMLKGRGNYLCLRRFWQYAAVSERDVGTAGDRRAALLDWVQRTSSGDRAELSWLPEKDPFWEGISAAGEHCLGNQCPLQAECFVTRLRMRAAEVQLLIVNHHLLFADLRLRREGFGSVLPRFQVAVLDEAHQIEDIATLSFGDRLSTRQVSRLAAEIERSLAAEAGVLPSHVARDLLVMRGAEGALAVLLAGREERGALEGDLRCALQAGPGRALHAALVSLAKYLGETTRSGPDAALLAERLLRLADVLTAVGAEPARGETLAWYSQGGGNITLQASPLKVAAILEEILFTRGRSVVLTSATLTVSGKWEFLSRRLGLPSGMRTAVYPAPFDYGRQALLYLPRDLPLPDDPGFAAAIAERIREILAATRGRALILFTSHANLGRVQALLAGHVPFTLLRQGQAPRTHLLERFRRDVGSVLLATQSFWEGIDVPGEALSCVIVDRLPFDSPGDPLIASRILTIREAGGNPFREYQLPAAVMALRQGLGRLLRSGRDRGVLCVLDRRIVQRGYGRFFVDSLPGRIPRTGLVDDIHRFFAQED